MHCMYTVLKYPSYILIITVYAVCRYSSQVGSLVWLRIAQPKTSRFGAILNNQPSGNRKSHHHHHYHPNLSLSAWAPSKWLQGQFWKWCNSGNKNCKKAFTQSALSEVGLITFYIIKSPLGNKWQMWWERYLSVGRNPGGLKPANTSAKIQNGSRAVNIRPFSLITHLPGNIVSIPFSVGSKHLPEHIENLPFFSLKHLLDGILNIWAHWAAYRRNGYCKKTIAEKYV